MKLSDLKPGDVFEIRATLDGSPAMFIRTGKASWERDNVMSTASFLPGTMSEKTDVVYLGRLQLKRADEEMREAERAVYGSVCRLCNRDIKGKLKVADINKDGWPACNECYKQRKQ